MSFETAPSGVADGGVGGVAKTNETALGRLRDVEPGQKAVSN